MASKMKYDALYASTPQALGAANQTVIDFAGQLDRAGLDVLDMGCGQGRDAIALAAMGHSVIGVDISPHGIGALNAAARQKGLPVKGVVADIETYAPADSFDIILFDRTLHMLDESARIDVFIRMIASLRPNGWVLIVDEKPNIPALKAVLQDCDTDWQIDHEVRGYLFAQQVSGAM